MMLNNAGSTYSSLKNSRDVTALLGEPMSARCQWQDDDDSLQAGEYGKIPTNARNAARQVSDRTAWQ